MESEDGTVFGAARITHTPCTTIYLFIKTLKNSTWIFGLNVKIWKKDEML